MRQARQDRYGGPEIVEVRDVPKPVPGAGQVLVKVGAASLSLADTAFRSATPFIVRFFCGLLGPRNLVHGAELAGTVEAVGQGVRRFAPGQRVFGAAAGAHGEYVCVPETAALVPTPPRLTDVEAAGLSYGYLTALPFLRDEAKLRAGQRLLVNGASGSVGAVAVQLARQSGAHVTAVCSARNADLVRSLGADEVIDYAIEDFAAKPNRYDVIFDAVGKSSFKASRAALKPTGIYLTTVPGFGILWAMLVHRDPAARRGRLATTGLRPDAAKIADLEQLESFLEAGLRPVIDRTYPLAEIVEAHRYVDTERKRGDVVITP